MRMQEFFDHHGLGRNPFADEDAQSDPVFKQVMSSAVFHPAWDKIYGRAEDVSTAIVFGEKGSGKSGLRLTMRRKLDALGEDSRRVLCTEYMDFDAEIADHVFSKASLRR